MMFNVNPTYSPHDRIRDIIGDNSHLLSVIDRFGIPLGFGDSSVEDVCRLNGVDTPTFIAVANLINDRDFKVSGISLNSLIGYLRKSHLHFIDYMLPAIKRTLIEGLHQIDSSDIALLILRFFDDYMEEVRTHMEYEDQSIFSAAEKMLEGEFDDTFDISMFSSSHRNMALKLNELKELFIYQFNNKSNEYINLALMNIIECGRDLTSHCDVENRLLFPAIDELQRQHKSSTGGKDEGTPKITRLVELLTEREIDIIRLVAQGLSNKEIADRLCLSFHTVTTYRRNIGSKLKIHSSAALAIFAIANNIVDINDIDILDTAR